MFDRLERLKLAKYLFSNAIKNYTGDIIVNTSIGIFIRDHFNTDEIPKLPFNSIEPYPVGLLDDCWIIIDPLLRLTNNKVYSSDREVLLDFNEHKITALEIAMDF